MERSVATRQGRLPQALRLAWIRTVEEANRFLREHYIAEFNRRFTAPVALGSLSLRCSPCIRRRCHACQTGEQHVSYVLYGRRRGRRFARRAHRKVTTSAKVSLWPGKLPRPR
jgi:hypothetical protein